MSSKFFKEIGVFLVYGWIFLAVFIYDWKPSTVFISFVLELVVMLLLFTVFKIIKIFKTPSKFLDDLFELLNVILGTAFLISLQGFLIFMIIDVLDEEENNLTIRQVVYTREVAIIALSIFVVYVIRLTTIKGFQPKLNVLQDNFLFQVLSFSLVNIVGVISVSIFVEFGFKPVLVFLILSRMLLEIKLTHKIRLL